MFIFLVTSLSRTNLDFLSKPFISSNSREFVLSYHFFVYFIAKIILIFYEYQFNYFYFDVITPLLH